MNIIITRPTPAEDVRPGDTLSLDGQHCSVDEVAFRRDDIVALIVRPLDHKVRRKILATERGRVVQVLPSLDQVGELAPVMARTLGADWLVTIQGLDDNGQPTLFPYKLAAPVIPTKGPGPDAGDH